MSVSTNSTVSDPSGFRAASIPREIGIGVVAGIAGWLGVIASLLAVAALFYMVGGEGAVPSQPPEMISWVVALPVTAAPGQAASRSTPEIPSIRQ